MAHTLSGEKRVRQNLKRRYRNRLVREGIKMQIKKLLAAIAQKNIESAKEELRKAQSILDKAVSKGVLHRNNAARRKSRLTQKVQALLK
jgi:small subunit ribosomal protein S20